MVWLPAPARALGDIQRKLINVKSMEIPNEVELKLHDYPRLSSHLLRSTSDIF